MRTTRAMVLGIALCLAGAGCDEHDITPFLPLAGFEPAALDGLWTGYEEITSAERTTPAVGPGTVQDGFVFPVALELDRDRTFVLRSFGYPIAGAPREDARLCRGVYAVDGNAIAFFPNDVCPALPLSRYTIGRSFPRGLQLEARTRPLKPGQFFGESASIRVRFSLELEARRDKDFDRDLDRDFE